MKFLLSSVLLASLCDISWRVSSTDALKVIQSPDVSVTEGETVNITCCFKDKDSERISIVWQKNDTEIRNTIVQLNNSSQQFVQNSSQLCSTLTFNLSTKADSGRYICQVTVEIPSNEIHFGNGTNVKVTSAGGEGSNHITIISAASVMVLLLLITLCCFCCLRLKQAQAVRVIYEVPHVDSVEAEMDKHSTTSSRGSSQWCQVPVYESLDYFERVQTKESG